MPSRAVSFRVMVLCVALCGAMVYFVTQCFVLLCSAVMCCIELCYVVWVVWGSGSLYDVALGFSHFYFISPSNKLAVT